MMCVEGEGGWMTMCREVKFKLTNISLSTPLIFPLLFPLAPRLPVSLLLTRHLPLCVWTLARVSAECLLRSSVVLV